MIPWSNYVGRCSSFGFPPLLLEFIDVVEALRALGWTTFELKAFCTTLAISGSLLKNNSSIHWLWLSIYFETDLALITITCSLLNTLEWEIDSTHFINTPLVFLWVYQNRGMSLFDSRNEYECRPTNLTENDTTVAIMFHQSTRRQGSLLAKRQ